MKSVFLFFLLLFTINLSFSQTDKEKKDLKDNNGLIVKKKQKKQKKTYNFKMNPLSPAKAAFYSAILPGLGQAYNKKYWIIPVFYGGMGASIYYYDFNNKRYNEFLEAYKLELVGKPHDFGNLDKNALERGIKAYKKNRDLSLFLGIGIYILNIVEANVDAHLPNRKIDTNLSYKPSFTIDPFTNKITYGAMVTFNF